MKKFLIVLLTFVAFFNLNAQHRSCNSMENLERQIQENPERAIQLEEIENQLDRFIDANQNSVNQRTVVTIPVVFHVVYKTAAQNISDAQLQSQLDVINEDFRRLNSDANNKWSQAADVEIEFCLASIDPNGNATTGITRTQTNVNSFSGNDAEKFNSSGGHDAWPTGDYLNFWVCNLNGFLGYAQFPGGPANTDGVTCSYQYTGRGGSASAPFDLGRTATHEIGHWLNLRHIWGDGGCGVDDFVSDTPTSDAANYGCASSHSSCGTPDMVENYMDYSDDGCMNLFTQGQKTRMQALFATGGARASLVNSSGCGTAPPPPPVCDAPTNLAVSNISKSSVNASWNAASGATNYTVQYRETGGSWTVAGTPTSTSFTITGLDSCQSHDIRVRTVCASGNSSYSSRVNFSTVGSCSTPPSPNTCDAPSGVVVSGQTNTEATITWNAVSGAIKYRVLYREVGGSWIFAGFATTSSLTITGLISCTDYQTRIRSMCGGGNNSAFSSRINFTTGCTSGTCTDNYEPNETLSTAAPISNNSTINAKISSGSDEDWFRIITTNGTPNLKVELTNLPDDYDMELYKGITLVDYSENAGTQDEQIIYNANRKRRYRVRVYGWGGANSPDCYDLTNTVSANSFRTTEKKPVAGKNTNRQPIEITKLDFMVTPNPASDEVNIRFDEEYDTEVRLSLMDATGKTVYNEDLFLNSGASKVTLPLENIPSGMYFVRATDGKESHTERLIIQKF